MGLLERYDGAWAGSNAFRLMPGDPAFDAPIRATVSHAANGALAQIAYVWEHPDDGVQEGLLVLGPGPAPSAIVAFWGDSWHQGPEPRNLEGAVEDDVVAVAYAYSGEWRWEIVVDAATPEQLTLTMSNVVPASAATAEIYAGPYPAMNAVLRPAG